jgi:hypothetical protein
MSSRRDTTPLTSKETALRGSNRRDQDKGAWGTASQLPSGNWRAMYWHDGRRHTAPHTFKNKTQARAWLAAERARVIGGT